MTVNVGPVQTSERLRTGAVGFEMNQRHQLHFFPGHDARMPWPQRLLIATVGVGLVIAAFFFFVFALITGAIVAALFGIRLWWVMRKLRAQAKNTAALEGEYTVVERASPTQRPER